ncbi:hypothetical protein ACGK9U_12975 [Mariniflexile sp. HNIBRBA6329]|uniref:hypothetical protein n=1 Tax=Mariniflexile sp. HNIBRBA6329 TaxID=3373088 RepID=UPI00374504E0
MKFKITLIFLIFFSCKIEESDLVDNARFEFENIIFDSRLDHLNFNGPEIKERVEDFPKDSDFKIYSWWTKKGNDTLRIYAVVHKQLKKKTDIHFSKNYTKLYNKFTK